MPPASSTLAGKKAVVTKQTMLTFGAALGFSHGHGSRGLRFGHRGLEFGQGV